MIAGALDLAIGLPSALVGAALVLLALVQLTTGDQSSARSLLGWGLLGLLVGVVVTWAGLAMAFNRVKVGAVWLTSGGLVPHLCRRQEVAEIKMETLTMFGKKTTTVPVAVRRDGRRFRLWPLESVRETPLSAVFASGQPVASIVADLRKRLGLPEDAVE